MLELLDDGAGSTGSATLSLLPADKRHRIDSSTFVSPPGSPSVPAPAPAPPLDTWSVERGDHLWAIAASHLTEALGREPSDAEIVPYWRRLIERNRARLADPGQPDLLFVGQQIELPPLSE
jgi:hypothetical protein